MMCVSIDEALAIVADMACPVCVLRFSDFKSENTTPCKVRHLLH